LLALPFRPVTAGILLPALRRKFGKYAMPGAHNYPPAKPEVLRLLPPQRGQTAIGQSQNPRTLASHLGDEARLLGGEAYCRISRTLGVPRQSRGFTNKKLSSSLSLEREEPGKGVKGYQEQRKESSGLYEGSAGVIALPGFPLYCLFCLNWY